LTDSPLADPIEEAGRIAAAARAVGIKVKLLGGAGIHLSSPSARKPPLRRKYGDLDYAIRKKDRQAVLTLFPSLGYEANERFNLMQGDRRLYFYDVEHSRQIDIFIDIIQMSHVIDLRSRLDGDGPCASPADLLLSKLQIYEVNRKDLVDLTALLLDHPVVNRRDDDQCIDCGYVAKVTADDWGMYRALQVNIGKLRGEIDELEVDRDLVRSRLDELWIAIEAQPKPLKWKLRAKVGDRVSWYELPEEVRSPYQPE
jgi:hypothetical protein